MRLLRRVCGLLARQRLQGEGGLDQRPYGHGPEIWHPGLLAAVPHLLDRRLCRRRSYPDGSHRPASLRAAEDRRDLVAGYAPGNAWYARQQARPAGHLRDREQSAEGLRDHLNGLAVVARQWR